MVAGYGSGSPPLALKANRTGNLAWKKMVENRILWKLSWKEELGQEYRCSEGKGKSSRLKVAGGADWERHHWILRQGGQGELSLEKGG